MATTGAPQAIASSSTFAHPSRDDASDEYVGGGVQRRQLGVRRLAQEAHPVVHAEPVGQGLQVARRARCRRSRAGSPGGSRAPRSTEVMALRGIRLPTLSSVKPSIPRSARARRRCSGRNSSRSTPLRSTTARFAGAPSVDQSPPKIVADGDDGRRLLRGPEDEGAGLRIVRNQGDVGAAPRDDHGQIEGAAEPRGRDAVRVDVVRVDDVELQPRRLQPPHLRAARRGTGVGVHAIPTLGTTT